jgi:hypothetical protein
MRFVIIIPLLLAVGFVAPPTHGQPSDTPGTMALSPNNCGTPDTPKPCHTKSMKAVHKASASYHK